MSKAEVTTKDQTSHRPEAMSLLQDDLFEDQFRNSLIKTSEPLTNLTSNKIIKRRHLKKVCERHHGGFKDFEPTVKHMLVKTFYCTMP